MAGWVQYFELVCFFLLNYVMIAKKFGQLDWVRRIRKECVYDKEKAREVQTCFHCLLFRVRFCFND